VKAINRVLEDISGSRSLKSSPTQYGFLSSSFLAVQTLSVAPVRLASFFHGPAFANS
jgi:hypothetical protein